MIAFPRRVPHPHLMECRQERTALADEPQPRRECVSRIGMNYLSDGHIDFRNRTLIQIHRPQSWAPKLLKRATEQVEVRT